MKKTFTFLIAALMLLTMISQPTRLWGQTSYKKVTTAPSDWSGTYIIVADESSVVFTGQDGSNSYGGYTSVSISSGVVTGNYSSYEVVVASSGDYYSIKHGSNYLGYTGSKNTLNFSTTTPNADNYRWLFSNNNVIKIYLASNTGRTIQYNANSGQERFATYTSSQKAAYLYKKAYTVTYNANGGSGTMTDSNSPYFENSSVTTKTNTFTAPASKVFDHWNTAADNSGTSYAEGATFNITANTTLYAQWQSTGPTVTIDPTSYNFGEVTVGTTPSPTHTFSVTPANLTADLTITVPSGYSVSPSSISQSTTTATNVIVTFTPTAVQAYNGNLTISGGGLGSAVTASLSGTGVCAAPATALAFPSYEPLTYDGVSAATQVLAPSTGTGNGGTITYTMKTNPGSAGSIVNGNTFSASGTGTFVITATQALNGTTCGDVVDITIVVNGTAPSCEITPSTGHNFGTILTNTSEYFDFSVAIANLEHGLTLTVPSGYEVSPTSIAANASSPVNVRVTFTPTAATTYNGNLSISGDDFNSPITAALSGTGDAGYTVTFNPYSGTCTPTSIRVATGGSIAELPTATADGATFYGWATSKIASTTTAPTSSLVSAPYTPSGDVTLHAVYKIAKEFDNSTACAASYKIYATVSSTDYYATGSISSGKYGSTTTAASGKSFSLVKETGYGNDEWAIKDGNNYVYYNSGANLGTTNSITDNCKWIITQGVKGTWRATSATTTSRAILFSNDNNTNKFGAYATSNIVSPNQGNYYDIEFASASFTYNSETPVAKPTYNIAGGSYAGEQSVTISCTTPGATIYYTTNGSDPTASSTEYTGAITVDETKTIKAIAIKSGMANSTVAYATYNIVTLLTTMDEIFAAASEIGETAQDVAVTFNNWFVSGKSGDYVAYVTDNNGKGFKIYKYGHGFNVNDKLSGTVTGTPLKLDNGASQFTNLATSSEGLTVTTDGGTITPVAKTISELGGVNTGAVVTISDLTYNGTNLTDGSSNTIVPNTSLFNYSSVLLSGHDYSSVTGVFVMNNTTKQIHPRSEADIVEVQYNITLNGVPSGCTIGTEGSITTAKYGQTVTLTQSAGDGYRFISWSVNSGAVTVTDNQFTMPKGNVTVSATFAQTYDIAYNVTPAYTGTVTAEPNPAIEGETVTLTIEPETGYALKSISAYKTGEPSTPVTITENTITMPAYGVTVAAEFATEYSVTYNVNGGTGDAVVVKYGAGATVNAADVPGAWTAPTGKLFKNWKTVASGEGTEYEVGAEITNSIAANYVLYAQWRDIVYHVSFSVNDDIISERNVAYNTAIGELPEDPELAPLTFLGWSSTSATGTTDVTAAWKPTGENENVTVYAVFGSMSDSNMSITTSSSGISNAYASNTAFTIGSIDFTCKDICQQGSTGSEYIQMKSSGYIYNDTDNSFGKITSIVVTYNTTPRSVIVKVGTSANPTSASALTGVKDKDDDNIYTFTPSSGTDYGYILIGASELIKVNSIVVYYEATAPVTINPISDNENINNDGQLTDNVTISSGVYYADEMITIPDGKTLTVSGTGVLVNDNPTNLVINDGGQLICNNSVAATFKKTMTAPAAKDDDVYGWELISSPVHDGTNSTIAVGNVNNLVTNTTNGVEYDMFAYDEASHTWLNQKHSDVTGHESAGFNSLNNGQGYMYRNNAKELSFVGNTNVADVEVPLTYTSGAGTLAGFHLVGNPYSENITLLNTTLYKGDAVFGLQLSAFYLLNDESNDWSAELGTSDAIANKQGFLIQISEDKDNNVPNKIKFSRTARRTAKSHGDNIKFMVANSQFEDVTYALFDNALPLNKIDHRNPAVPMIYISKNNQDYAVATMSDDTKAFNLGFKAGTMGKYTLSYKADGNFDYIHIIDRLTGEDIDMLLDNEYSFIASPSDNDNRFIVKLSYAGNESSENEIFAYQSGNDIVVNGEGELQVFDVMGRMVMTQRINGVETINVPTNGMYIFRLNEKVQKIVVE